ncbi:MAG: hypothetical protein AB1779_04890 [Candidatus Thermoplasmatota archaeon]
MNIEDIIITGLGLVSIAIAQEHLFTFMLSSCFTARNLVKEKGDSSEVMIDLWIAVGLSEIIGIITSVILKNIWLLIFSVVFPLVLTAIYMIRGKLI